jgi:hypothetical protein
MAIVTGHESISERIMAEWLVELKSARRAPAPVRVTLTAPVPRRASRFASLEAADTIWFVPVAAPAVTTAVLPLVEIETFGRGASTLETSGLALKNPSTLRSTDSASGSAAMAR